MFSISNFEVVRTCKEEHIWQQDTIEGFTFEVKKVKLRTMKGL